MTMDDTLRSELDYRRGGFARGKGGGGSVPGVDAPAIAPSGTQAPPGDWNYEPQADQSWKMYPPGVTAPVSALQASLTTMATPDTLSALSAEVAATQDTGGEVGPTPEQPTPPSIIPGDPNVPEALVGTPTPPEEPIGTPTPVPPAAWSPLPPPPPGGITPTGGYRPLSVAELGRYFRIQGRHAELGAAGEPGVSAEDQAEYARYQQQLPGQPADIARQLQIIARSEELRSAGQGDVSVEDQIELQRYHDAMGIPTARALSTQERSRYDQILARDAQLKAAGQPGVGLLDQIELRQYQAMLGLARTLPEGYTPTPPPPGDQTGAAPFIPGVPTMGTPHI